MIGRYLTFYNERRPRHGNINGTGSITNNLSPPVQPMEFISDFHWINVEGHDDKPRITDNTRFCDNWVLSSARSMSVVRRLEPVKDIEGRVLPLRPFSSDMLQTTGRFFCHPVIDRNNLEQNHRVDLVLVYDPQRVLQEMLQTDEMHETKSVEL